MQILLEAAGRQIGSNPFDFFMKNYIPNGAFVSIGYIKDDEIKIGPTTKKRITPENDAQLTEWIKKMNPSKFRDALIAFQNSEKYQMALEGKVKTAPFYFATGDCHIIKINRFIMHWRNGQSLAKWYGTRSDAEKRVRAKHGFGNPEDSYAEDDWRRKHGGVGINREIKATGRQGNRYRDEINGSGFYANLDDPSKISIRLIENPKAYKKAVWLFVDSEGNVEDLDNELMGFLIYSYKAAAKAVADAIQEINQDEQAFLDDLQSIKNWGKHENTLMLDKILYLTGTTIAEDGSKEPFTWLNKDIIAGNDESGLVGTYPYLRKEVDNIISRFVKQDTVELEKKNKDELLNLTESQMRNKRLISRYFDIFSSDKYARKAKLNESDKRNTRIGKKLNETLYYVDWIDIDGEACMDPIRANSPEEAEQKLMDDDPDNYIDYIVAVHTNKADSHIYY